MKRAFEIIFFSIEAYKILVENLKGKDHSEGLGVDRKIILE
jgi:hypothetical protein